LNWERSFPPSPNWTEKTITLFEVVSPKFGWLLKKTNEGTLEFRADSDAIITRGLVALVIRALDKLPPAVVAGADLWFVQSIGLDTHLSPTRANGLLAMIQQMKHYGIAFQAR
jgi:cysteine desulfuration protein SufE